MFNTQKFHFVFTTQHANISFNSNVKKKKIIHGFYFLPIHTDFNLFNDIVSILYATSRWWKPFDYYFRTSLATVRDFTLKTDRSDFAPKTRVLRRRTRIDRNH